MTSFNSKLGRCDYHSEGTLLYILSPSTTNAQRTKAHVHTCRMFERKIPTREEKQGRLSVVAQTLATLSNDGRLYSWIHH